MATRRRRRPATATNSRRRRTTTAANPRRRRNRTTIYAAAPRRTNRRRANPVRRRNRRHNPQVKTLLVGSMFATAGAMAQGIISGFVPIHATGIMGIAVELGVAYLTAMLGEKVIGGQNAQFFAVGAAAGVGKSILNYVFGLAQSGVGALSSAVPAPALPAAAPQMADITYYPDGVGDIVETPEYWPTSTW
jgi:hypothetical protein